MCVIGVTVGGCLRLVPWSCHRIIELSLLFIRLVHANPVSWRAYETLGLFRRPESHYMARDSVPVGLREPIPRLINCPMEFDQRLFQAEHEITLFLFAEITGIQI